MATEKGWTCIAEVAARLQVTGDSIYRRVDAKGFPARRVGRLPRFRLCEVDDWVKTGGGGTDLSRKPARKQLQERAQEPGGSC